MVLGGSAGPHVWAGVKGVSWLKTKLGELRCIVDCIVVTMPWECCWSATLLLDCVPRWCCWWWCVWWCCWWFVMSVATVFVPTIGFGLLVLLLFARLLLSPLFFDLVDVLLFVLPELLLVVAVVTPAGFVFLRTFFVFGSLLSFFHFMRLFWNQIFICRSERTRVWAISILRLLVR